MKSIEPHVSATAGDPGDPDELEENVATDLVDLGLDVADAEREDAVADVYVEEAKASEDREFLLADAAREEGSEDSAEEIPEEWIGDEIETASGD